MNIMIVGICAELLIVVMESLVWSTKQKEPQIVNFYGWNNYTCHFLLKKTENCISQRLTNSSDLSKGKQWLKASSYFN